jgi:hypothetical protein
VEASKLLTTFGSSGREVPVGAVAGVWAMAAQAEKKRTGIRREQFIGTPSGERRFMCSISTRDFSTGGFERRSRRWFFTWGRCALQGITTIG